MEITIDKATTKTYLLTCGFTKTKRHTVAEFEKFIKTGNCYIHVCCDGGEHVDIGLSPITYTGYIDDEFKFTYNFSEEDLNEFDLGQHQISVIVDFPFKDKKLYFRKDNFTLPLNPDEKITLFIT